ncbi:MAG: type IV secretion system DNA-binding domain-containing protein [bacterium]|nr:type IV secretion system DNA-binding domain-containing protein [bacterium]
MKNSINLNIENTLEIIFTIHHQLTLITSVIVVIIFFLLLRAVLRIIKTLNESSVILEITPPASTEKTSYTTEQLFSVIHNLGKQKTLADKLLANKLTYSCEIVSTHTQGIRYIIRTKPDQVNNLQRSLLAYLPEVKVTLIDEYLPNRMKRFNNFHYKIVEFAQTKVFAYSLKKQNTLEEHDPVAYITGMMTKLIEGEMIAFQIVLSPIQIKEPQIIKSKILQNEDVLSYLEKLPISYISIIALPLRVLFSSIGWAVSTLLNDLNTTQGQSIVVSSRNIQRSINAFEQQAVKLVEEKIDQQLFETQMRLLLILKDKTNIQERIKGFISSLGVFTVPNYQSLKKKITFHGIFKTFSYFIFRKRLLSFLLNRSKTILSISEISDLYHFPFTSVTQTENIVKVYSKELPAPLSLKNVENFNIVFAKNTYGGATTMIGLQKQERARHMYVIGATGSGKTTMLTSMISQDIKNGNGICVVDPHGDLAESLLDCITDERINDLVYFNPYDIKYPIGVNLLELSSGLEEDDALLEKEFITESVISLFRKMFSDGSSGHPHRIEYILRNTIHTAFTVENATLFTIFDLLNNPVIQKKAVMNLQDENLRNFWKNEFGKAGDYQQVKMTAPITSRIGRFLFSPSAKRILEQVKSTINFDEILDQKKILICNLSKGNIGEDTSEVMGIMILNKIQLAALKRARRERKERNEFYLFVDEFQNFATPSFVQMLSEARKYGLNLTIAEQSTSQQNDRNLTHVILANVGTVVSFRSANPIDADLFVRQFSPYIQADEIANLPAYHFYMKTSAIHPEEPFSGETMPLHLTPDKAAREKRIDVSRNQYAIDYHSKPKPTLAKVKEVKLESKKLKVKSVSQRTIFPEG